MSNRWTNIRRQANEFVRDYEHKAAAQPLLKLAFTEERGCHAVLKEMLRYGFDEEFMLQARCRTLSPNVQGRLDLELHTVEINETVTPVRKAFIIAHEIGHIKLKHPPRQKAGAAVSLSAANDDKREFIDTEQTVDEQSHPNELVSRDGIAPAYRERDRIELEANIFAAEFLAPLQRVREQVKANPDATIGELAEYFGLSEDAMRNQMVAAFLTCPRPDALEQEKTVELPDHVRLNDEQRAAATSATPALIVAGPGAGKTRVLTSRFVHMVEQGVEPRRILALTFSNKAAAEMQERIGKSRPDQAHEIQVFTFHSFGRWLLQSYGHLLGFEDDPAVLSDADSFVLARDHIHELHMGEFHDLSQPTRHVADLLTQVQKLKEEQIRPDEFLARVEEWEESLSRVTPSTLEEDDAHRRNLEEVVKCRDLARFYADYERIRERQGHVDYADLINLAIELLGQPEVAAQVHDCFRHILVDEYQDINRSCGQLVRAVDGGRHVLWAVADPRQSIYGFRGASVAHLARFGEDYPGAKVLFLTTNHRSVEEVVVAGNSFIFPRVGNGEAFQPPPLRSHRGPSGHAPVVHVSLCNSFNQEVAEVVANVREAIQSYKPEEIAILCRLRWQAKQISAALEQSGIATNWSGQPEEQDAFKDVMAILQFATNQPQGLVRLARMEEHFLCEEDLRLICREAGRRRNRLRLALKAAVDGEIEGVSPEGREMAHQLGRLSYKLELPKNERKRTAWDVLSRYFFDEIRWLRAKLNDDSPDSRRYLATLSQVIDLAREFSGKGSFSESKHARAFLDYVASARESRRLPCSDSTAVIADAVNVLTMHASKGLEWKAVFVTGWNPSKERHEAVPLPSHLIDQHLHQSYDEACLHYVAVTRAEDRLFLSAIDSKGEDGKSQIIPYLGQIVRALRPNGLVSEVRSRLAEWKPSYPVQTRVPFLDEVIPYAMIRQYEYCPQRAKYDYVYGLRAESGGFLYFKRQLCEVLRWIANRAEAGDLPTEREIEEQVAERWDADSQSTRRMSKLYQEQALKCACCFAERTQPGARTEIEQVWEWEIENANPPTKISFKVSEVRRAHEGAPAVVHLHRLDRANSKHKEDPLWSLYATLTLEDEEMSFYLSYLGHSQEEQLLFEEHESRFKNQRQRMSSVVGLIRKGDFKPTPKDKTRQMCKRCPYNLICPG